LDCYRVVESNVTRKRNKVKRKLRAEDVRLKERQSRTMKSDDSMAQLVSQLVLGNQPPRPKPK